jgi:hypothetical protein
MASQFLSIQLLILLSTYMQTEFASGAIIIILPQGAQLFGPWLQQQTPWRLAAESKSLSHWHWQDSDSETLSHWHDSGSGSDPIQPEGPQPVNYVNRKCCVQVDRDNYSQSGPGLIRVQGPANLNLKV